MIRLIDTRWRGQEGVIAVFAVPHREGVALVESGPEVVFPEVVRALNELGYELRDVTDLFLTHIHLDHAAGAWRFAEAGARVHVHPRGAPHLENPEKLLKSAGRLYGERMGELWGEVRPVPKERLHAAEDGEVVRVGGLAFRAHATPGHASHHHVWELEGALFTGDVGGVRLEGGPTLPPTPPPDISLEDWRASLNKLRALSAETLYPTHFGAYRDKEAMLAELEERLFSYAEWVRRGLAAGKAPRELVPEFEDLVRRELSAAGLTEEAIRRYEAANPSAFSVLGLARYWQKRHDRGL